MAGSDYKALFNKDDSNTGDTETQDHVVDRTEFLKHFRELFIDINKKIKSAYEKNKKKYDQGKTHGTFNVGQQIFKKTYHQSDAAAYFSKKLAPLYEPCIIHKKISDIVYELKDEKGKKLGRWHIKDLRKH